MGEGYGGTFTRKPEPQSEMPSRRRPANDFSSSRIPLSRNLYISRAMGNEAVLRLFEPKTPIGFLPIQRQAEEEKEETLQTEEAPGHTLEPAADVEAAINALQGGGRPLPKSDLTFFEPSFGYDFSHVRLHTDTKSAQLASRMNARAFTRGNDIVFGEGQYGPGTDAGNCLLAHELTHVVQQAGQQGMIHRWAQAGVSKILCKNEGKRFVEKLNQLKICEFKSIKCKYKYLDKEGNWEVMTEESDGESDPETGEVYIRKDLSDEEASSTLVHEVTHLHQKEKKDAFRRGQRAQTEERIQTEEERRIEKQQNEYEAWIETEKYRIKAGLPEQAPDFRIKKGKTYVVDEAKVREYVDSLYTRSAPNQTRKYRRIGCYEDGVRQVETPWKCPRALKRGSGSSGKQETRRLPVSGAVHVAGNRQIQRTAEDNEGEESPGLWADQPDLNGSELEQAYTHDSEIFFAAGERCFTDEERNSARVAASSGEGDLFAGLGSTGGTGFGNTKDCKIRRNECYWQCFKFHMGRFPPDLVGFADCKKNCCDWAYGECLKDGSFPCVFGKSV
ncbi:MAG: hypothetical protein A4E65_01313 [Syntrophorhabdus sp. PtaU1.Bin153]|nr:MAG: hypothetical protein A4E65_01313 [Syntrophorhabdus sp. PtaU1.Bin153]